jgi:hypothetical protein
MKIRLLQLDGKFPNIALMKISTYFKRKGYDVDWYTPSIDFENTDILYVSKIFEFTPDYKYYPVNCKIEKGGTGFDIYKTLPFEIDIITELDYSLYPNCNYSVQFYSRGCTKYCAFCVVPDKEGGIISTTPYNLNPKGKWIEILDNNFFAAPRWEQAIEDILNINQPVNFHGIQLETIDEKVAKCLNKVKLHKQIKIAWDDPKDRPQEKMKEVLQWIKPSKIMCYVLIGYNSKEKDDVYRVEELSKLKIDPYVMPYNKKDKYQKEFQRWSNGHAYRNYTWYQFKKTKNLE